MYLYPRIFIVAVFLMLAICFGEARTTYGQPTFKNEKIRWSMTVVVMDGIEKEEKAEIPVKEAVEFIEKHTRFVFDVRYVTYSAPHGYTPYRTAIDVKHPRRGYETRYAMMGWNLPKPLFNLLPVSTSYLFLYKLKGKRPAQAGSALGLEFGLIKGGKPRPYATVTTDQWWYVNTPKQGFRNWSAQVLTHEIINTIQAKLEARPYRCGQLTDRKSVV